MADETTGGITAGPADASNESSQPLTPAPKDASPLGGASSSVPPASGDMKGDIAKILSEVKLPERHDLKGSAEPHAIPIASSLIDIDAPAAAPAEAPQPAPQPAGEGTPVVGMHTFRQDIQSIVKDQKLTLTKAAALEADRQIRPQETATFRPPAKPSRARGIVLISFALLFLGLAALFGVYYVQSSQTAAPVAQNDSLLFAEQSVALPTAGRGVSDVKQALLNARTNNNAQLGSITRIVPLVGTTSASQRPATLSEFFAAIGANPPADLVRALGDQFFLGLHTVDKNAPVLVIPVTSYERAFAGMLAWETTMNSDLSPLFTPVPQYANVNGIPTARTFSDLVMRNYDVRALKDDSGTVELYYSFPTRDILVIAESPYTFAEVLTRLQASRHL